MEESFPEATFKWSAAESIDSFAAVRQNDGKGKCGYDAPRRGLNALGIEVGEIVDYHKRLLQYARNCKASGEDRFIWKWNSYSLPDDLYRKVESVEFGTGKQFKRSNGVWVDVRDFMLVSGCFQTPVFVYVNPQGRTRTKKKDDQPISTTIFVPIGDVVVSIRRKSEITLPFEGMSLCIYLKDNHYQWMQVKDQNTGWSTWAKTINPLQVLAACADRMQNAEHLYNLFKENANAIGETDKKSVVDWLNERCKQYSADIAKLTTPSIRVCAWDPFCKSAARDCGGFTPKGCKNYKNKVFHLPDNFQEVLEMRSKQRAQEQVKKCKMKRKALDQATKDGHIVDPMSENKKLKCEMAAMKDKMDVMLYQLDSKTKEYKSLKDRMDGIAKLALFD